MDTRTRLTSPSIHRSAGDACIPSGARLPYKGSSATSERLSRTTATPTSIWSTRIRSQLFKRHNLECPRLDEYITHREEHLENVIRIIDETITALLEDTPKNTVIKREHARKSSSLRRDEAKTQFLRVMYGGKPDTLCIETRDKQTFFIDWTPPDFLRLFHKEFQKNSTTLLSLDEFKTYLKDSRSCIHEADEGR